jgi:hypothetical protein
MSDTIPCHLCNRRPPRRACPALDRTICAPCCGSEREQSIGCPFDCVYLRDARAHDKPPQLDARDLPNQDIDVSERFLSEQERLVVVLGRLLLIAAMETEGAVDYDLRDALAALTSTYKTAASGLIYEAKPANAIAASLVERFQRDVTKFREDVARQAADFTIPDRAILGVLVFWQRMEFRVNNQRRKGRAFIESLFSLLPKPGSEEARIAAEAAPPAAS